MGNIHFHVEDVEEGVREGKEVARSSNHSNHNNHNNHSNHNNHNNHHNSTGGSTIFLSPVPGLAAIVGPARQDQTTAATIMHF